ncbi:MBL fold metallo-hydrolase [Phenylobacterium sp.]|uniref:MBL fold metallo-hydrolase n=1 Tax=Phenylobacterium sp. TaxID=1871053 RepID=UPI00286BDA49|nr:MBL fold metallo-hydrolase [Phenylobacterium sp.]
MRVTGLFVIVFAVLCAALGFGMWAAPEELAGALKVGILAPEGLSTLRGDLGGLFVALAALCFAGVWTRRTVLLQAAALVLFAIVVGRLTGVVDDGLPGGVPRALVIEIAAIVALALHARALGRAQAPERAGLTRVILLVLGLGVAAKLGFSAALANPTVQQKIFERAVAQRMGADNSALLADDALRVAVCGTSAPLPSKARAKACVAVIAGGRFYIVDVGPESVENLMQWGVPLNRIGGVLITHFHSDHIGDLGELNLQTWAQGRPAPLNVYGGPGIDQVVGGFNQAYRIDQGYRTVHHTAKFMPPETWPMVARTVEMTGPATPAKARTGVVLDDGKLKITAIEVDHGPIEPAYAYRFDYKGRSVVISGDIKNHPPLARAAMGADILVSEAIARPMVERMEAGAKGLGRPRVERIMHDIQDYHISPQEAAGLANQAKVKLLVFYHLLPAPDGMIARRTFESGIDAARDGAWTLADDGSLYTLPLESKDVRIGRVPRAP